MAYWDDNPLWVEDSEINGGYKYEPSDGLTADDINAIVGNIKNLDQTAIRLSFRESVSTTIAHTLSNNDDITFLANNITEVILRVHSTVQHGFCSGANIKTGSSAPSIQFVNQTAFPLKVLQFGLPTAGYVPSANKTISLAFYCDGINVYCYINEV